MIRALALYIVSLAVLIAIIVEAYCCGQSDGRAELMDDMDAGNDTGRSARNRRSTHRGVAAPAAPGVEARDARAGRLGPAEGWGVFVGPIPRPGGGVDWAWPENARTVDVLIVDLADGGKRLMEEAR